ncbi:MAG: M48 family metallopeptidase [Desulfobacteraceae bacterium]|nr:M48 family metallopeptidase [Desulfobacteraceae bacterium]
MDFFVQQDKARSRTWLLVLLFILAVVFVIVAVYAAAMAVLFLLTPAYSHSGFFNLKLFLIIAGVAAGAICIGSIGKIAALSRGGDYVAEGLGGKLISPSTRDPDKRRLINVVEEMAIASGTPVPWVYLLENENGINAFAAGFSPSDAVIGVTRGCCSRLSRGELQGVIAHEFSHILNGDMRLNIRLMGFLGGIMMIATAGSSIFRSYAATSRMSGRRARGGGRLLIIAFFLLVIGYMGVLLGRLIQSAVSRQREYLADASAVQFTRSTAIADALKKIGGLSAGSKIISPAASEACHMFFGRAVGSFFATHPPLIKRIRKIEPGFTGDFDAAGPAATQGGGPQQFFSSEGDREITIDPNAMGNNIGRITPENIAHGAAILADLPESIRNEAEDILGACALVCALLLDRDPEERQKQKETLRRASSAQLLRQVALVENSVQALKPELRLPLLDIVIPTLRQMSPEQFAVFKEQIRVLVQADSKITLFEFCLQEVLNHRLEAVFERADFKVRYKKIDLLEQDAVLLLAALARVGHKDKAVAEKAFYAALSVLPIKRKNVQMPETVSLKDLHTAFDRFSGASYGVRKIIFDACCQSVLFDGRVAVREAELLRAVASAVDIPVPPPLLCL